MDYVIIGGGLAGLSAAESIRKNDKVGKILMLSSEKEYPYARYQLPEFLSGDTKESDLQLQPAEFFTDNRIEIQMGETVEEIDIKESTVSTSVAKYHYEKLLITTGGRPLLPRSSLLNIHGVFVLRSLADAREIDSFLQKENVKEAAVVGSGIVGLKAAYMLNRRGINVSIVEQESRLLPRVLDSDSLAPISSLCWRHGFKILLDERFREFLTSQDKKTISQLVTYSGQSFRCQAAILCPGLKPEIALAESAGLSVREGIVVDEHMATTIENVFAAGDAVETLNVATGKPEVMPLWRNALNQGHVAGANMAGREMAYAGALWHNSLHVFGLEAVTLGQSHLSDTIPDATVLTSPGLERGSGIRLVLSDDKLMGATLLGEVDNVDIYKKIIMDRIPAWDAREELLDQNFDSLHPYL